MVYIETPRLLLRDWKEEDFVVFSEMNSSPSVMKYFLHPLSEEESLVLFDAVRSDFLRYGYGGYAVEQKSDGAFVGFTGFHNFSFDVDFAPGIEIAWRLKQEYWNRGYATEAAKACLDYAKENLPFTTVWAFIALPNKPSQRVMQKIGMEFEKNFMHPSVTDGHPLKEHVLYKSLL